MRAELVRVPSLHNTDIVQLWMLLGSSSTADRCRMLRLCIVATCLAPSYLPHGASGVQSSANTSPHDLFHAWRLDFPMASEG